MQKTILVLVCLLQLFWPRFLSAEETLTLFFIYPGGEGSTQEAQELLDQFFALVKKNGGPSLSGAYYPSQQGALQAIQNKKPQLGLVSLQFYLLEKGEIPMEPFLATLPSTSPTARDVYYLVSNQESLPSGETVLLSSKPMDPLFVSRLLFPRLFPHRPRIQRVDDLMLRLRNVGSGQEKGVVLLDAFEYQGIQNLHRPWAQSLKVVQTSKPVPSSPLVLFREISGETRQRLEKALITLSQNPQGKDILRQLRLNRFDQMEGGVYEEAQAIFSKTVTADPKIPASSPN